MRKATVFLAVLLLLTATAVFASGGKESTSTAGAKQTELTFLYYIDATQAGYADDQAIWQKFIDQNPDIKVVKEELFNQPFHDKVQAYIAAGTLPDVMYMWPSGRSSELHRQHLMKDLNQLLGKDFLSNFVPAAVDPNNQLAHYMAMLPQSVTYTTVVYANTKMLADNGIAVPKTTADYAAMVPKLKSKGLQTVVMSDKDGWQMQSCVFSTVVGRMLGDSWVDGVLSGQNKFTDAGFVNALNVIAQMFKDGIVTQDVMQVGYDEATSAFAAGKGAFTIDGDWRQGFFVTDKSTGKAVISPADQKANYQFLNFPAIPGEKNPGTVSAVVGVGFGVANSVPAGSDTEKAAIRWMKYYYSEPVQQIKLETGSYIPSLKGVTSDKLDPFTTMMMQYYASVPKTSYVLDGVFDAAVATQINTSLQEIGLGTKTTTQAAADIQKVFSDWKATQS